MSWRERAEARWAARMAGRDGTVGGGGGPASVTAEVFIARSAQAIWDAMADTPSVQRISPCLVSIEPVAGSGDGVGRQVTETHRHGEHIAFAVTEVLDEHPPAYLDLRVVASGLVPHRFRRWCEHTGAGCRVRWQLDVDLAAHVIPEQREAWQEQQRRSLEARARRWRELLETGQVHPPDPCEAAAGPAG